MGIKIRMSRRGKRRSLSCCYAKGNIYGVDSDREGMKVRICTFIAMCSRLEEM